MMSSRLGVALAIIVAIVVGNERYSGATGDTAQSHIEQGVRLMQDERYEIDLRLSAASP